MKAINSVLGVISITGGLVCIIALLAFVVASWINQPPIGKQHLAQSSGEKTLESQAYPLSNGTQEEAVLQRVDMTKKALKNRRINRCTVKRPTGG
jgi:hypothetical protein